MLGLKEEMGPSNLPTIFLPGTNVHTRPRSKKILREPSALTCEIFVPSI